jgi:predicted phage terminase large subunit-like protein
VTTLNRSTPTTKELDWLLSLDDSTLERWLRTLATPTRQALLARLTERATKKRAPTSPAELAARVWGSRWRTARHLELLNEALTDLAARKITRLMVMMPPRHGKSVLTSQFFPAWYLGVHPEHRVILASYEAHFAAGWGRKARDVLAERGKELFGATVRPDASAANRWDLLGHSGGMVAAGVGGPITGRGADLLIVDDPVKNAEQAVSETYRERAWEWWTSTAFTRLEPDAVAVIVQTRWHEDDLAGRILREQADENWRVVSLPALAELGDPLGRVPGEALWPERFPLARLKKIRAAMPAHWWESLYQQTPGHHDAVLWPPSYFAGDDLWFDQWPDDLQLRVVALDPSKGVGASRGDYSAYVLLGVQAGGRLWVEADLSNTRPPLALVEDGARLYERFRPHAFYVEANAWQDLLRPLFDEAFRKRGLLHARAESLHNRVKKQLRIEQLDPLLRHRQIRFRRTAGTELLVRQLKNFPVARHDDGPDALEMAVRAAQALWSGAEAESVVGAV